MAYVEDRWAGDRAGTTGRRYRVRWRDPDGRQRARSFDRKGDADRFAATTSADVLRGTYVDPDGGRTTLAEYAEEWLAGYSAAPTTRASVEHRVRHHILPALGRYPLARLRPTTIRQWLTALEGTLAPGTIRGVLKTLHAILRAAVDDGLLASAPTSAASVSPPALPRRHVDTWSRERCGEVAGRLPEHHRVLVAVGSLLGLRQGEAFGLAVEDVDFLRRIVRVRRQVVTIRDVRTFGPPKGGRERTVPLPEPAAVALSEHIRLWTPAGPATLPWGDVDGPPASARLIVRTRDGAALSRNTWNKTWRRATGGAGRGHGFHVLRHTYASALIGAGVSAREVAEYLGHADPGFTLRVYGHLLPDSADRARSAVAAFAASPAPSEDEVAR